MNITVSPELESLINRQIADGNFEDAEAVVAEALQLLNAKASLDWLKAAVREADEQIERGEWVEHTPQLMDELVAESERRFSAGERPLPDVLP